MSLIHRSLQESQLRSSLYCLALHSLEHSCSYKWYKGSLAEILFRQTVTQEVNVSIKQGDVCVIEPPDGQPKSIQGCPYNIDDPLIVTYYEGSTNVESHRLNK